MYRATIETPIVLVTFKRQDSLKKIVELLKQYEIKNLVIVSDGPRSADEARAVNEVRTLLDTLDAENLIKIYADSNRGLKENLTEGVSAALEQSTEALVLEDDCIPSHQFLELCDKLAFRLRNNSALAGFCGTSFLPSFLPVFFWTSRKFNVWGWIAKREVWREFIASDMLAMNGQQLLAKRPRLEGLPPLARYELRRILKNLHKLDTWDVQFEIFCIERGLSFLKNSRNHVRNEGFDTNATNVGIGKSLSLSVQEAGLRSERLNPHSVILDYLEHSNKIRMLMGDLLSSYGARLVRFLK